MKNICGPRSSNTIGTAVSPDNSRIIRVHILPCLMLPSENHISYRVLLCSVLLLFCWISPAAAHIEKGSMPDSVAEMEYRILLEFEPENLEVRNQLGMVLYRLGKLDDAEKEFHYVLKKAPENFNAIDALGLVNLKRTNFQLAIDLFKKAITLNPDDMLVYLHLGQALEQQGDVSTAAEMYRSGLSREISGEKEQSSTDQRQALLEALKNIQEKAGTTQEIN
jgi:tetratricopeptide (TPR) repeat protein